jgi:hypothetical protein
LICISQENNRKALPGQSKALRTLYCIHAAWR